MRQRKRQPSTFLQDIYDCIALHCIMIDLLEIYHKYKYKHILLAISTISNRYIISAAMTAICVVDCRIVSIAVVIISEARVPPAGQSAGGRAGQGSGVQADTLDTLDTLDTGHPVQLYFSVHSSSVVKPVVST